MDFPTCWICFAYFLSILTSVCIYGINLCISIRCSNRSRGSTIISYFITDPSFSFSHILNAIKSKKPIFVCYRNKKYFNKEEILKFIDFAKKYSKIFINYDVTQDKEIINKFDGIHFPSKYIPNLKELKKLYKDKIFITSTHSSLEAKNSLISDYITFSPIFNSKGRKGVGIEKLNEICNIHPKVIALGGIISEKEIKEIKKSKAIGFGSIRYFLNFKS